MDLISQFVQTVSVMDTKRAPIEILNDDGAAVAVLGDVQFVTNTQSYGKFI